MVVWVFFFPQPCSAAELQAWNRRRVGFVLIRLRALSGGRIALDPSERDSASVIASPHRVSKGAFHQDNMLMRSSHSLKDVFLRFCLSLLWLTGSEREKERESWCTNAVALFKHFWFSILQSLLTAHCHQGGYVLVEGADARQTKIHKMEYATVWWYRRDGDELFSHLWHHGLEPPPRLLCPWDFPGKNTGAGCHFLLQGIFPTQGSNLCLLHFLHWQADSLPLESPDKPWEGMGEA